MATRKKQTRKRPATPKRNRAAGKTRKELDVRANVKRWVQRNACWGPQIGNYIRVADMLRYLSTMDTRANARRGGGGVK